MNSLADPWRTEKQVFRPLFSSLAPQLFRAGGSARRPGFGDSSKPYFDKRPAAAGIAACRTAA